MTRVIVFNKLGYDPFLDFIKAYAIICVLIGHTFPYLDYWGYGLWAGMQVPLFILIQAFHTFKKDKSSFSLKKTIWRVLVPFLVIQVCIYMCMYMFGSKDAITLLKTMLNDGGYGPGSYFPWVYLQIAVLLPFFYRVMNKLDKKTNVILALLVCESLEILSSVTDLSDSIYRLLAVRYLFLIYLGYLWAKEGVVINCINIVLICLSMASIIYFEYFMVNDEPVFFNTGWKYHRWPCYFYVAYGLVYILYSFYNLISKSGIVNWVIKTLAKCSYEIFLVQMAVLVLLPVSFFQGGLGEGVRILMVWTISILFGILFNKYYNLFVLKFVLKK